MAQYLDLDGLRKFKEQVDAAYLPIKGTIPLTDKINLTTETKASLGLKYAKVTNNTINFYIIADSNNKLPSSETRININSDITSLVGAEGANVGDLFVIGKLNLLPVYKIIPLNDAKAANSEFKGTQGVVTPWDKQQINKVSSIESTANAARNNMPTYSESNMNNALRTGMYPWCTLGRPDGSTGAYTLLTLASTTADSSGYTTIEQTAYGRQNDELGKVFKRIIFKKGSEIQFGEWIDVTDGGAKNKSVKTYIFEGNSISIEQNRLHFNIPDSMVGHGILDIRGVIPCFIQLQDDTSEPDRLYYFPLSALGYRINYADKMSDAGTGDQVIEITINNSMVYDNKTCNVTLHNSTNIYIEVDCFPYL